MAGIGRRRQVHQKSKFRVIIPGTTAEEMRFYKAGPLEEESETVSYKDGASHYAEKFAGDTEYSVITLERGVTTDSFLREWRKTVINSEKNSGGEAEDYKREVVIEQLDRNMNPVIRYVLNGAWPKRISWGDFDATAAGEVNVQELDLEYDFLSPPEFLEPS